MMDTNVISADGNLDNWVIWGPHLEPHLPQRSWYCCVFHIAQSYLHWTNFPVLDPVKLMDLGSVPFLTYLQGPLPPGMHSMHIGNASHWNRLEASWVARLIPKSHSHHHWPLHSIRCIEPSSSLKDCLHFGFIKCNLKPFNKFIRTIRLDWVQEIWGSEVHICGVEMNFRGVQLLVESERGNYSGCFRVWHHFAGVHSRILVVRVEASIYCHVEVPVVCHHPMRLHFNRGHYMRRGNGVGSQISGLCILSYGKAAVIIEVALVEFNVNVFFTLTCRLDMTDVDNVRCSTVMNLKFFPHQIIANLP